MQQSVFATRTMTYALMARRGVIGAHHQLLLQSLEVALGVTVEDTHTLMGLLTTTCFMVGHTQIAKVIDLGDAHLSVLTTEAGFTLICQLFCHLCLFLWWL